MNELPIILLPALVEHFTYVYLFNINRLYVYKTISISRPMASRPERKRGLGFVCSLACLDNSNKASSGRITYRGRWLTIPS